MKQLQAQTQSTQVAYDLERTRWLNEQKHYRVLRFTNREVMINLDAVLEMIRAAL